MRKLNKRGLAIVVVLFFSFSIGILLFFMSRANIALSYQSRKTIRQMQAYYLAHSAMQHAKLQLKLLPKECQTFFSSAGTGNPFSNIDTTTILPLSMGGGVWKPDMGKYDLFSPDNCDDDAFPYAGRYWVSSIEFQTSDSGMKLIQDGYVIEVESEVKGGSSDHKSAKDELSETIIVSRYTSWSK